MSILTVGQNGQYQTIAEAVAAAQDGDVVQVAAGTYLNDFTTISNKITLEAVGGPVIMQATEPPTNGKGILTVDNDATVIGITFEGAAVPGYDGANGAGIRYEGGQLVLQGDTFEGNQDGLLGGAAMGLPVNTISINDSTFTDNGVGDPNAPGYGSTHNLYVSTGVQTLTVTNSTFTDSQGGHEIKSRAATSIIQGNTIVDGPTGTGSYDIDLPNGGNDLVQGNTIEKGPEVSNEVVIAYGEEGNNYGAAALTVTGNTVTNDYGQNAILLVNRTNNAATVTDNTLNNINGAHLAIGPVQTATGATIVTTGAVPSGNTATDNAGNTSVMVGSNQHTITVGPDGQFQSIAAAVNAANDGDVVQVEAGTYVNDCADVHASITLEAVGGPVIMQGSGYIANGKGLLIDDAASLTVQGITFEDAEVTNDDGGNGAGIRYEGGDLVLQGDTFLDNQNGLLGGGVDGFSSNTILINDSTFSGNGVTDPSNPSYGGTHNLYVSTNVQTLTVTNSTFTDANVGHEIKSRAYNTTIENNVIEDGPTGTGSYDIDLPNGGNAVIQGNTIEKGPNAQNDIAISYSSESMPYASSSLLIQGNTIINDLGGQAILLHNAALFPATLTGNTLVNFNSGQLALGAIVATDNTNDGAILADSTSAQALPTGALVFNDADPHTVTLDGSISAVEGGAGLLTVSDIRGRVDVEGGSGGMNFAETDGAGASDISTAPNSTNTILVYGEDQIRSQGNDTVTLGTVNSSVQVSGTATIYTGTGNQQIATGAGAQSNIVGQNGAIWASAVQGGTVNVTGTLGSVNLQSQGGNVDIDAMVNGAPLIFHASGGSFSSVSEGPFVTSTGGSSTGQGDTIDLVTGNQLVSSSGADTIYAAAGDDTVIASSAAQVHATGNSLQFWNHNISGATIDAASGNFTIGGDGGGVTFLGGSQDVTLDDQLGRNVIIGGAGRISGFTNGLSTVQGGAGGLNITTQMGSSLITTAKGSSNTITFGDPNFGNTLISQGNDTINAAAAAGQSITATGNSSIVGSTGSSSYVLSGTSNLVSNGPDQITVAGGAVHAALDGPSAAISEAAGAQLVLSDAQMLAASVSGGAANLSYAAGWDGVNVASQGGDHYLQTGGSVQFTGGGRDTVLLFGGADTVSGGGNDAISTYFGNDTITGGSGNNTYLFSNGNDVLSSAGNDLVLVSGSHASVTGTGSGLSVWETRSTLQFADLGPQNDATATVTGGTANVWSGSGWNNGVAITACNADVAVGSGNALINTLGASTIDASIGSTEVHDNGQRLTFIGNTGYSVITQASSQGDFTFGSGNTRVNIGSGADVFHVIAGQAGGTEVLSNFKLGTDKLMLQGGDAIASTGRSGGGGLQLNLTDGTKVVFTNLTSFDNRILG